MSDDKLDLLRARVTELNRRLLGDLNERLRLVREIFALKSARGLSLFDPAREQQMLDELARLNPGPASEAQIREVFRAILLTSLSSAERRSGRDLHVFRREGQADRMIEVRGHAIGGGTRALIAEPASLQDEAALAGVAARLVQQGCRFLKGRDEASWPLLRRVADSFGMAVVGEVAAASRLDLLDVVLVGVSDHGLLEAAGRQPRPVILRRDPAATLEELVLAAEQIAGQGNDRIVLCERACRSFAGLTCEAIDLAAVQLLKRATVLPVVADATRVGSLQARAALAAGADGIVIEAPADLDALAQLRADVLG